MEVYYFKLVCRAIVLISILSGKLSILNEKIGETKMEVKISKLTLAALSALLFTPVAQSIELTTAIKLEPIIYKPLGDFVLVAPKLDPVYVQKWGRNTYNCGTQTRPCLTINQGIYRAISTGAPYSASSISKIYVGPGKYTENVRANKTGIRISSTHGTDSTIIEASNPQHDTVHISADGVYFGKYKKGFTLTGSTDSNGLFSTGSYGQVYGNRAVKNGVRGFQFGNSSMAVGPMDPSEPITGGNPSQPLVNVTNVSVYYNIAESNGEGGFYFSDFDNSTVRYNEARNNLQTVGGFIGFGSGYWIDMQSNNDRIEYNIATGNERSGFFYRRFGVTDQITRYNQSSENQSHGYMLMGDALTITYNTATNNADDGFHYMGYDQVLEFAYNTSVGNTGTGVTFGGEFAAGMTSVDDMHHNNFINNNAAGNCGLTNNFQNNGITPYSNFWGNMYVAGPGANPADDLCGMNTVVATPTTMMN